MALHEITLRINGTSYTGHAEARKTLADFIREDCGLTGTHLGCEHGVCGACTILMNGEAVRSCLLFAVQAAGAELMTVEGMADGDRLHPIQEAYWEHHALQCGFCTPGFLMTSLVFLRDNPNPTEQEIREGLSGNLCRCTGYQNIVKAVAAAGEMIASGKYPDAFPAIARPGVPAAGNGGAAPAGEEAGAQKVPRAGRRAIRTRPTGTGSTRGGPKRSRKRKH
jgi:aerobic carbon-monoxide dehydrogenase small subunit